MIPIEVNEIVFVEEAGCFIFFKLINLAKILIYIKRETFYFLILKKLTHINTQDAIRNSPPIGVMGPNTLKLKVVKSLVDNKYIEPENNIIPVRMSLYKIDFCFGLICLVIPIKNNKKT